MKDIIQKMKKKVSMLGEEPERQKTWRFGYTKEKRLGDSRPKWRQKLIRINGDKK